MSCMFVRDTLVRRVSFIYLPSSTNPTGIDRILSHLGYNSPVRAIAFNLFFSSCFLVFNETRRPELSLRRSKKARILSFLAL